MRWLAAVLLVGACGRGGSSPVAAVRALVEAARGGDVAAVMARLGPRTRARLEADAVAAGRAGRRELRAADLVAVGWTQPRFVVSDIDVRERHGDAATVEIVGKSGERETIETVREKDGWKVELP